MFDAPGMIERPADRVCQLHTAELLALAAGRLWVAACLDPARPGPDWRDGFAAAGLDGDAADSFDALFGVLAAGATRAIAFHCPTCVCLGRDEARLLLVFAHLQRGRYGDASILHGDFLAPAGVRLAMPRAAEVAQCLLDKGLQIPVRGAAMGENFDGFLVSDQRIGSIH